MFDREILEEIARESHIRGAILALGRRGRAILVGRGANWLLDPACGLRLRLVSPLPARIARVAAGEGLAPAEARERIRQDDAARARFIRQAYRQEIDDPTGYDLILNVGSLAAEAAAECALAALRHKLGPAAVGRQDARGAPAASPAATGEDAGIRIVLNWMDDARRLVADRA